MSEIPEEELHKFVSQFLKDFKDLTYEKGLLVTVRVKNTRALLDLGLTGKQREEILLGLEVSDYCSGPTKDIYRPGDYWEFGKQIDGIEIYIKLKIAAQHRDEHALCLSFHKAEYPLKYHFNK